MNEEALFNELLTTYMGYSNVVPGSYFSQYNERYPQYPIFEGEGELAVADAGYVWKTMRDVCLECNPYTVSNPRVPLRMIYILSRLECIHPTIHPVLLALVNETEGCIPPTSAFLPHCSVYAINTPTAFEYTAHMFLNTPDSSTNLEWIFMTLRSKGWKI